MLNYLGLYNLLPSNNDQKLAKQYVQPLIEQLMGIKIKHLQYQKVG
jgi:hypothetical protein